MPQTLVTAPTEYPVTLSELKAHCRVSSEFYDDDAYLEDLIKVATDFVEDQTSNRFITQTWDLFLDDFPDGDEITLPFGKLQSVTYVTYTDSGGVTYTLDPTGYDADTDSVPGRLVLAYGETWPSVTLSPTNPVSVRFVTGYGARADVPYKVKQAVKLYAAHLYENREPVIIGTANKVGTADIPMLIDSLLADYRMRFV
jgi:uncharacterized phiE125 gp8 family phage protein